MEHLLEQVPELQLTKRSETRTIHRNDLGLFPNHREGDVITIESWFDHNNVKWTETDVSHYIKQCNKLAELKSNSPKWQIA